ncbi:MAG: cation:proton antiporter [Gammaproteobacteria bacterium]|nr:cation:proton antiporter [Gammaproteobacteria bacterium]
MTANLFPSWPLEFNQFLLFGMILFAGLAGGQLAHRTGYLPRITGFIFCGFLLGPSVLNLLDAALLEHARVFVDIALGLILFQLGMHLDLSKLRQDRSILATSVLESALSFTLIYFALTSIGISPLYASLAGAAGISVSPAVVLLVVREIDAQGPVTQRALTLVALNNTFAFFAFTLILPMLHAEHDAKVTTIVLQPLYMVAGSILLAYLLGQLTVRMARFVGKHQAGQFALMVGVVIAAIGTAKALALSTLLTLLVLGVVARNIDRNKDLMAVEFGHGGEIFFVILFVVSGANLHLSELITAGGAALVFVATRFAGKASAMYVVSRYWGGLTHKQSAMLGMTTLPMAGLAIGIVNVTSGMYLEFGAQLGSIILAAVAILETIGPIATEFALKRAGEVPVDGKVEH